MSEKRAWTAKRVLKASGATLGTAVTFVLAAVGGAVLHMGTPSARRLIAKEVNVALADNFRGHIEVESIKRFGLGGIEGLRATLYDPEGERVLVVDGVRARIGLPTLAWSFLSIHHGEIPIDIRELHIDTLEATLAEDATGTLTLVRAFEPKNEKPASPESPTSIRIAMPHITVDRAWIHGATTQVPHMDAELRGVAGSFVMNKDKTEADVAPFSLTAREVVRGASDLTATLDAHFSSPSATGSGVDLRANVDAHMGELEAHARAFMSGDHVVAMLDVPRTEPSAILRLVPTWPVRKAVALHVGAAGDLPRLVANGWVTVGEGGAVVGGEAFVSPMPQANVVVTAWDVDPRDLAPAAPPSKLSAVVRATTLMKDGALTGDYWVRTVATTLASEAVPSFAASGSFTQTSVRGRADIDEPGAPATVVFDFHPEAPGARDNVVDFDSHVSTRDLHRVRRIARLGAHGSADVRVHGRVALRKVTQVDARVDGRLSGVSRDTMSIESGSVSGHVHGPVDKIEVDATVRGHNVKLGGQAFSDVAVTTQGPITRPFLTASLDGADIPHVEANAFVRAGNDVTVRNATVKMQRNGVNMTAKIASARMGQGTMDLDGIRIEGLGQPVTGSLHVAPNRVAVKASAPSVDLRSVATLLGRPADIDAGELSLDVDVLDKKDATHGHVDARLRGVNVHSLKSSNADVHVQFDGRNVDASIASHLGEAGTVDVRVANGKLSGSAFDPRSWRFATGDVNVLSDLDLARVAELLPHGTLPVEAITGRLDIRATVARPDAKVNPSLTFTMATHGLGVEAKHPEPPEGQAHPHEPDSVGPPLFPWKLTDLDLDVRAHVEGATGRADLATKILDPHGTVLSFDAHSSLPFVEIERTPARAMALLEGTPIAAHLDIPERALESLPPVIRPHAARGFVGLTVDVTGTALAPQVALAAHARGLQSTEPHAAVPMDVVASAHYDAKVGDARIEVTRPGSKANVLEATSHVEAKLDDIRNATPGADIPWTASANVTLARFPVQTVPIVAERRVEGFVSGQVRVDDLHKDARLGARIDLESLKMRGVLFPHGVITVDGQDGRLHGSVRLENAQGMLSTQATAAIKWGAEVAPTLDDTKPMDLAVDAKNFRARALMPALEDAVNELDGRLDANARIHVEPGLKRGTMDGAIELTDGRVEIPSLGEEFRKVHARVDIKPWGTLRIQNVSAESPDGGRVAMNATGKLDGFNLQDAQAQIRIGQRHPMPLSLEGVPLGHAWGDIDLRAKGSQDGRALDVTVDIPKLRAELSPSTGHAVQPLEPDPAIQIGMLNRQGAFVLLPMHAPVKASGGGSSIATHVAVNLGDILIKRSTDLHVTLGGKPVIDITDKTHVTGEIHLRPSFVDVMGKRFLLDRGTVSFIGDNPADPEVVVTAYHDAPDGTRIFADITGHVKTINVKLRSEPARSQNEILSLLLFGTIDGETGTPPPDQQGNAVTQAAGVAGGFVTQGLNKALSGVSGVEISTRLDTQQGDNPRPEVDVRVAERVLVAVLYNLGLPPPGQNPDKTEVRVDWRFAQRWTLDTTIGDHGTSIIDLLWQHRY